MAATDNKKYNKARYRNAVSQILGRQLTYILVDVNYNHGIRKDYTFKGDYAYLNAYDTAIEGLRDMLNSLLDQKVDPDTIMAFNQLITFVIAQHNQGKPWTTTKLRILQRFDLYCATLDLACLTKASDTEEDRAFAIAGPSMDTKPPPSNRWKPGQGKLNHTAWQQQSRSGMPPPQPKKARQEAPEDIPRHEWCKYHVALWTKKGIITQKKCGHRFEGCTAFTLLEESVQQAFLQSGTLPGKP